MGIQAVAITGVIALVTAFSGAFMLSSGTGPDCTPQTVDVAAVTAANLTVDGFSSEQITNAALIINAGISQGLDPRAQSIGVMTAIGETSLRNLATSTDRSTGNNTAVSTGTPLGLFQQDERWGRAAERLDPTHAAAAFFVALSQVPNRESMTPSAVANFVQGPPALDYTPVFIAATDIVTAVTAAGTHGCVSSDPQVLAAELVRHADDGSLVGSVPDHIIEIRWIAQGRTVANCGIDVRILQVIVIAVRHFQQVGVSDINRLCTEQIEGAGTTSAHYINGGGHAVDFITLNGRTLDGADGQSLALIGLLDPLTPTGSRIGQSGCRAAQGIRIALVNLSEFADSCTHLHVDVAFAGNRGLTGP